MTDGLKDIIMMVTGSGVIVFALSKIMKIGKTILTDCGAELRYTQSGIGNRVVRDIKIELHFFNHSENNKFIKNITTSLVNGDETINLYFKGGNILPSEFIPKKEGKKLEYELNTGMKVIEISPLNLMSQSRIYLKLFYLNGRKEDSKVIDKISWIDITQQWGFVDI